MLHDKIFNDDSNLQYLHRVTGVHDQHFLAPILCNIFKKTCNILRIVVRSVLTMSTLVMSYRKHVVPVTELFFKQTALKYIGTSKSLLPYRQFCCPVSANIPVSVQFLSAWSKFTTHTVWNYSAPVLHCLHSNYMFPVAHMLAFNVHTTGYSST